MTDAGISPLSMARWWGIAPEGAIAAHTRGISGAIWSGQPQEIVADPDPEMSVVGIALDDFNSELFKDGHLIVSRRWLAGCAQIVPAGVLPRAVLKTPWRVLHVYVPQNLVRAAAEDAGWRGSVELVDPLGNEDRDLRWLARQMSEEIFRRERASRLRIEGIGCLLGSHLVRRWSNIEVKRRRAAGLSPWQLSRCIDLLRSRFADEIALSELAAEARLSPFHFARAFKAETGLTPHGYQVRIRFEAAQQLLETSELSLGEIAHRVGYADQGNLSRLFQKSLGTTPSQYRRERRR